MSDENEASQDSQQNSEADKAEFHLALKIAREAVLSLGIPDIKTIQPPPFEGNWRTFVEHQDTDIFLIIECDSSFRNPTLRISLFSISYLLLQEIRAIFKNENAIKYLDIPNSETEELICWRVKEFLIDYIRHLPPVLYHSISQALKESIIHRIRKYVEPDLREHWQNLGLPKNFGLIRKDNLDNFAELFPNSDLVLIRFLEENDRRFSNYRKTAYANRRRWLTQEAILALPDDYKRLSIEYKRANKFHNEAEATFNRNNNRAQNDAWRKHWLDLSATLYPHLTELDKLNDYSPYQLAELHLARAYDYSRDSITKKIKEAKNSIKERKRYEQLKK